MKYYAGHRKVTEDIDEIDEVWDFDNREERDNFITKMSGKVIKITRKQAMYFYARQPTDDWPFYGKEIEHLENLTNAELETAD